MSDGLFGPYRLEALLGRGGMGEVHRAVDTVIDRVVALKRLAPHLAADTEYQSRFRRESHAVARLRDPHVIPIHNYGEIDGRLFIDMRLVDGENLADLLTREGGLPPARAVDLVAQVASALTAAHAEGIVHRDVKPSNVLITGTDFVYLVDFGVAQTSTVTSAVNLTKTGATVGTLDYMAPERFGGGPTDHRVDVYALGCLLFQTLTGRKPFPGDGLPTMIYAHLTLPPPRPSEEVPELPAALDAVVARGMAKEPEHRYPTAAALAAAARGALPRTPEPRSFPGLGDGPTEVVQRPGPPPAAPPRPVLPQRPPDAPPPPAPPPRPYVPTPAPPPPPPPRAARRGRFGLLIAATTIAVVVAVGTVLAVRLVTGATAPPADPPVTSIALPIQAWTPVGSSTITPGATPGSLQVTFPERFWGGAHSEPDVGCDYTLAGMGRVVGGRGYGFAVRADLSGGQPVAQGFQYDPGLGGYRDTQYPDGDGGKVIQAGTDSGWHQFAMSVRGDRYEVRIDGTPVANGPTTLRCGGLYLRVWDGAVAEFRDLTVTPG